MLTFAVLENFNWFWLVVGCLAAWRLTNVIHWEGFAKPIRRLFGVIENDDGVMKYPKTFFGKLLSCFWCLSVWVSFLVAALVLVFPFILIPFAISAVASILEEASEEFIMSGNELT